MTLYTLLISLLEYLEYITRMESAMNTQLNEQELFGGPGKRISNIKFFPGSNRDAGPQEYKSALHAAVKAIQEDNCEDIPLNES